MISDFFVLHEISFCVIFCDHHAFVHYNLAFPINSRISLEEQGVPEAAFLILVPLTSFLKVKNRNNRNKTIVDLDNIAAYLHSLLVHFLFFNYFCFPT